MNMKLLWQTTNAYLGSLTGKLFQVADVVIN